MKHRLNIWIDADVRDKLERGSERGYDSMTHMIEVAVRRLWGDENGPLDRDTVKRLVEEECKNFFAFNRKLLRDDLRNDLLQVIDERIQQFYDSVPADFTPPQSEDLPSVIGEPESIV